MSNETVAAFDGPSLLGNYQENPLSFVYFSKNLSCFRVVH